MKLTFALALVLGLTLCLAKDANNTKKAHPLVNRTDGNQTHPVHPVHPIHPLHPRPHHKQNETNTTAAEPQPQPEAEAEATNTTDDVARLLAGKRNAGHHERKGHKDHKGPGKHLRGHHEKPAEANNATKPAEPEENNESEEAQVNEEESVVAEQGEDAEEAAARLLADKKVRKNKRGAPRRGHKKHGKHGKRHHDDVGENAEGVIGGEDAEDIEHELRRLLPQIHQGNNNNNNKKQGHAKKGGRPHWKKPQVKPELKPEDFDFFGEHHIFGEDAFENGEGFGFGWNHHNKKH